MHFIFRHINIYTNLGSISRFYSTARKTHYEVLKVPRNCTDKQIKDAFIQLSKEYHPDKNKDARAQEKFVQIVEAYSVLGKPSSRAKYDCVRVEYTPTYEQAYRPPQHPYYTSKNYEYSFYENTHYDYNKTSKNESEQKHYYGIRNVNKVNNSILILIVASIAIMGFLFQMLLVRQSFYTHKRRADEKSQLIALDLEKVRTAATENGNEIQTQLLLEKIVKQSNPTVATATLGQSLAKPKNTNQ